MNRKHRPPLVLALAVACVGAAVGTALAVGTDTASDPLPTREEVYHDGMSLEEIAATASGRPGDFAPPCPDEETATRLKQAGLEFGPCDLLPEGAPVRIADPRTEPTPQGDDVVCPGIILKVGPGVTIPCGRGAEIIEATSVEVDGRYCAKVTYIAQTDSPFRTETLCEGDVPSIGGEPVTGPPLQRGERGRQTTRRPLSDFRVAEDRRALVAGENEGLSSDPFSPNPRSISQSSN